MMRFNSAPPDESRFDSVLGVGNGVMLEYVREHAESGFTEADIKKYFGIDADEGPDRADILESEDDEMDEDHEPSETLEQRVESVLRHWVQKGILVEEDGFFRKGEKPF